MTKAKCINVSIHTHGFSDIYIFFKFIELMFLAHNFRQVFFHKKYESSLNIKLQTFFFFFFFHFSFYNFKNKVSIHKHEISKFIVVIYNFIYLYNELTFQILSKQDPNYLLNAS
jgi:predicted MPP superfamily phosphohydrolase